MTGGDCMSCYGDDNCYYFLGAMERGSQMYAKLESEWFFWQHRMYEMFLYFFCFYFTYEREEKKAKFLSKINVFLN